MSVPRARIETLLLAADARLELVRVTELVAFVND